MVDLGPLGVGLEAVAVPAVLSDLVSGLAIGANAAASELLAVPPAELIGSDVISHVHPEERAAAASGLAALASGAVDAFQARDRRVVRTDGAAVVVDISGRRVESETGRLALWVLAPAEDWIAAAHGGRQDEVVFAVTDHDWQLEYVSADARLVGSGREGLAGTALLGLVHPSAAADFVEAASRAVTHRMTVAITAGLRSERGEWIDRECLLVPMCEHDPPRLGIVVTPIPAASAGTSSEAIAAHVRHTAADTRAADALDTLATITGRKNLPELSPRQIEILSLVVRGDAVDDIATALYLSPSTVRNHLTALYRKFGVHSRSGLLTDLLRSSSASDRSD